jgi:osmotically-inducible protein OsmY
MIKLTLAVIAALFLQTVAFAAKNPKPVTDDTITDQVRIKLAGDPVVKGGGLDVKVQNGVATLSGVVEIDKQKERAGVVARKVKGVKQVVNNIQIKTHAPAK